MFILNFLNIFLLIKLIFYLFNNKIIEKFNIKSFNLISINNDTLSKNDILKNIHTNCFNTLSDKNSGVYKPEPETSPGCYIINDYMDINSILSNDIINNIKKTGHIVANKLGQKVSAINMNSIVDSAINKTISVDQNISKDISKTIPLIEEHVIKYTQNLNKNIAKEIPLVIAHSVVAAMKISHDKSDPEVIANMITNKSNYIPSRSNIDNLIKSGVKDIGVKVKKLQDIV